MTWWLWFLIGVAVGIVISFVVLLLLIGCGMAKTYDESNCERLRRLGEEGFYDADNTGI